MGDISYSPLEKKIRKDDSADEFYENYKNSGIAIIFNQVNVRDKKPRNGTENDVRSLNETLSIYGFDVRIHNDLTLDQIQGVLQEVAREDHTDNDCLMVFVMSHGTKDGVFAKDELYEVQLLWNYFRADTCKTLMEKPLLFFIQSCRGETRDIGIEYKSNCTMGGNIGPPTSVEPTSHTIIRTPNILVFYATMAEFVATRESTKGSWFIQSLCSVLDAAAENAAQPEDLELLKLLTAVIHKVAYEYKGKDDKKQMPTFTSTLTKLFQLQKRGTTNSIGID